jgi:hypothetical protein
MPVSNVGNHVGEIVATGLKKAASSGNVQVLVQFRDEEGNAITAYLATTEAAWPYTEKKLAACGFVMADNDFNLERLNDADCPIIGMKGVPFTVKTEADLAGEMQHRVGWIGEGGGISERMSPDETKVFAAQLRQRLIAGGGKATTPAPTGAKKPAPWAKGKK